MKLVLTLRIYEVSEKEVWGEVLSEDGTQVVELTEDSVPELLDGFAEILGDTN